MLFGDLRVNVALIIFLVSAVVVPKEAHPRHGRRVSREIVQPNTALGATVLRRIGAAVLAAASATFLWLVFAPVEPPSILGCITGIVLVRETAASRTGTGARKRLAQITAFY
jgi:hypothetical protein